MRTWLLFYIFLFSFHSKIYSQSQELFLGSGSGTSIVATGGQNFIVTVNYFGLIYVTKIDSGGNQFWQKNFGLATGMNPNNMALQIIRIMTTNFS